jgi:hypothetical protein
LPGEDSATDPAEAASGTPALPEVGEGSGLAETDMAARKKNPTSAVAAKAHCLLADEAEHPPRCGDRPEIPSIFVILEAPLAGNHLRVICAFDQRNFFDSKLKVIDPYELGTCPLPFRRRHLKPKIAHRPPSVSISTADMTGK